MLIDYQEHHDTASFKKGQTLFRRIVQLCYNVQFLIDLGSGYLPSLRLRRRRASTTVDFRHRDDTGLTFVRFSRSARGARFAMRIGVKLRQSNARPWWGGSVGVLCGRASCIVVYRTHLYESSSVAKLLFCSPPSPFSEDVVVVDLIESAVPPRRHRRRRGCAVDPLFDCRSGWSVGAPNMCTPSRVELYT